MLPFHLHLVVVSVVVLLLPTITVCFSPPPVTHAAGKLVNSTIWFFGGYDGRYYVNTLLSLDVSQSFSLSSPPWTDHSSDGANKEFLYTRYCATLDTGADDNILWVYGGQNKINTLNQI